MRIDENSMIPIYVQIADGIEDDILTGRIEEGGTCYSQVTLAKELRVNPATAAKGINLLVNRGILIKHRGQAMTVSENAIEMITKRKRHEEIDLVVDNLIKLGKKLSLSKDELIEKGFIRVKQNNANLRKANIYEFCDEWKRYNPP